MIKMDTTIEPDYENTQWDLLITPQRGLFDLRLGELWRYRDLRFLVTFGVQLPMYATPVIYPVSSIPERFQPLILANPLTPIVEAFRYAFLGAGTVDVGHLLYSFVFMLVMVFLGAVVFNRVKQTFMDTV